MLGMDPPVDLVDLPASVPRHIRGRAMPGFSWERSCWERGIDYVAGVDEVGRGALAGPLVAAAVIFPRSEGQRLRSLRAALRGLQDSKCLDPSRRAHLAERIGRLAVVTSVGAVPNWEIDHTGLAAANRLAMERAIWGLGISPETLLLDACTVDHEAPQVGLIRGDAASLSIAAASVVAKVTRDALMADLDVLNPNYGFHAHKGYGTRGHLSALREHGPGPFHRRSFAPVAAVS
ncbi:MAG TPA: ribonuclease HII [Thermomicrobiales bacterium]|nr:ribonuclease HII [Thermomicrobiales bacterium]